MNIKTPGLSFYQMVPQEDLQNRGILALLLHFHWTWIGLLVMDNENGERFLQSVVPLFYKNGVCLAFIGRISKYNTESTISDSFEQGSKLKAKVMGSKANVNVFYGESYSMVIFRFLEYVSQLADGTSKLKGKVWIMTAQMELTSLAFQSTWDTDLIHGALSFTLHSSHLPEFTKFVELRNPCDTREDGFLRDFWQQAFDCIFPNAGDKDYGNICTGKEKLDSIHGAVFDTKMTGHSYSVYNAVYALAHALCAMLSIRLKHQAKTDTKREKHWNKQPWQLIYGAATVMNTKTPGLSFYQMVPQEDLQNRGILALLLHFHWTWIGLLVMDNENGERFLQSVVPLFYKNGVCFAFIGRIPKWKSESNISESFEQVSKLNAKVMGSNANVNVFYGESYSMVMFRFFEYVSQLADGTSKLKGKVWIMTAQMELTSLAFQSTWDTDLIHGALSFTLHSNHLPEFTKFVEFKNPFDTREDGFLRDFWQQAFHCKFPNAGDKEYGNICTGKEKLDSIHGTVFETKMTGHSYSVYNAVYALAHAVCAMPSIRLKHQAKTDTKREKHWNKQPWQVNGIIF
ncbi:hypothetical protein JD844_001678 [Phrynosoma platyrhinos]|uniref:Receptor ligand binding region domain-containing protein n=1 Tax=Phrynosoma platyrhinos TaxID=52577 RepID=A0ABQ7TB08_PHRPL|nr:hypothetical protein JD844_001678 [Phrynosoma platyrhinos]